MKKLTLTLSVAFSIIFGSLKAQEGTTLNLMTLLPQYSNSNPAKDVNCNWYFSFPGLSMFNARLDNELGSLRDLRYVENDTSFVDFNRFVGQMSNKNNINGTVYYEPINLGFRVNKGFVTFSVFANSMQNMVLTKQTLSFLLKGPSTYMDQELPISGNNINSTNYGGAALGYSYQVNDRLTVGVKFKYLVGLANINSKKMDFTYFCNSEAFVPYTTTINTNIEIQGCVPGDSLNIDAIQDADWAEWASSGAQKNKGMAFDFGATYQLNDKLSIGASILDLGFIKWKGSVKTITSNSSFTFSGVDIHDVVNDGQFNDSIIQNIWNDLKDSIDFIQHTDQPGYKTRLRTKFTISANYQLTKNDLFGATFKGDFNYGQFIPSLSLGYQRTFFGRLGIAVNNSIIGDSFWNFGAGLTLGVGPVQLYIIVDQINSLYIDNMRGVNVQTGLNFVFGTNPKFKKQTSLDENGVTNNTQTGTI